MSIDPGLRGCGVAFFTDSGVLEWASWVKNPTTKGRGPAAWDTMANEVRKIPYFEVTRKIFCEMPQVYPGMPKTDVNDLLDLAGVLGAVTANASAEIFHCAPAEWKGQVPKAMMNERVMKLLSTGELLKVVSVGALDHNTYDSIGIGLFFLKRMKRGGAK
jgi:hypothetical protein